jgi:serpin B
MTMRTLKLIPLVATLLFTGCSDTAAPTPDAPSGKAAASTPGLATSSSAASSASAKPVTSASAAASAAPNDRPVAPTDPAAATLATKLAASSNAFGFDLLKKTEGKDQNLAMSPASLTLALAMTWGGAQGDTATEMQKTLHLGGTPDEVMLGGGKLTADLQDGSRKITIRIANRLFGEKTYAFEQPFLDATKKAYGAGLEPLDFKKGFEPARATINGWVESQTEKRIRDLIPKGGIDDTTRLVLTNAIYFLGDWAQPFKKESTSTAKFTTQKGASVDCDMMHQTESFKLAAADGVKVLELPYDGGAVSMLVVLPDDAKGLGAVESKLDAATLDAWSKDLKPANVRVSMPKFEIDPPSAMSVGKLLQELGMKTAFTRKADFRKIANPANPEDALMISSVFHKAFVKVDEKGTEAAAASAVVMSTKGAGAPPQAVEFTADHPFLFVMRDNATGLVLFVGRVADPTAK